MRSLALGSLLLPASAAVAQEGGQSYAIVDVVSVEGALDSAHARAVVAARERAFWRCREVTEGTTVGLVVATSGEVRSAHVSDATPRARACLRHVALGLVFPPRRRASTLTLVLRWMHAV